jgi:hypothetical protein
VLGGKSSISFSMVDSSDGIGSFALDAVHDLMYRQPGHILGQGVRAARRQQQAREKCRAQMSRAIAEQNKTH